MSEEDRLILRTGQGWVSQLEQKITDMQKEMQRKQRAQVHVGEDSCSACTHM